MVYRLIRSVCSIATEESDKKGRSLCLENIADSKARRAHTWKRICPVVVVYQTFRAEDIRQ
ncbi:MAG: hypothetical protein K6F23_00420 [Solobacterium sp.]|nr:hypothetical protein [Solobacterium sp.]